MIVQKVFEPLNAMLEAYKARLKPKQTLAERWNAYPDPVLETGRLEMCRKLIQAAQDLLVQQDNGGKKQQIGKQTIVTTQNK